MKPALNDLSQSDALTHGLATISDIVARHRIVVDLCWTGIDPEIIDDGFRNDPPVSSRSDAIYSHAESDPEVAWTSRGGALLNENFRGLIVKLYKAVLVYQIKAACYLNRNTVARMARNLPKLDDWTGLVEDIRRLDHECRNYKTLLDAAYSKSGLERLFAKFRYQEELLEKVLKSRVHSEKTTYGVLSFISEIVEGQDHEDIRDRLGERYRQSGHWLLCHQVYMDWKRSQPAILWLRGPVGVGKTCLTSTVIQECLSNVVDQQVAFFYCSQQQRESADILRSLLAQLSLESDGSLAKPTLTWFEHHTAFSTKSGRELPAHSRLSMKRKTSVAECLDLLAELMLLHGPTTIIIDALDECYDPYEFLGYLESLLSKSSNVRVFISTRLGIQETSAVAQNFVISQFDSSSDLQHFIDTEISSPDRRSRSGMTPAQASELRDFLISRAKGM